MGASVIKEHVAKSEAKAKRLEALPDPLERSAYQGLRGKIVKRALAAEWLKIGVRRVKALLSLRGLEGRMPEGYGGRAFDDMAIWPADAVSRIARILEAEGRRPVASADWFAAGDLYSQMAKALDRPAADFEPAPGTDEATAEEYRRVMAEREVLGVAGALGIRTRQRPARFSNGTQDHRAPWEVCGFDAYRLAGVAPDPSLVIGYRALMIEATAEVDGLGSEAAEALVPFAGLAG